MEERRTDPADGTAYTFQEILGYYKGEFKRSAIQSYWDNDCTPVRRAKGAGKSAAQVAAIGAIGTVPAKGGSGGSVRTQEKATAKAKTKPEPKPRTREKASAIGAEPAQAESVATAKAKARTGRTRSDARVGPANPKRFINEEKTIVQECIDGLIWSTPSVGRLDTFPDVKVVFRTDWDKSKVALVSGGGAGHEPLHGGFVGKGMLAAAVSGETFASPSIDAVLAAIVQVTGPAGCLLVIKNYTGDRLNFTLAAQRARAQHKLKVEIVITKDDVATVAERGVAGTLFVHKVAGALAEQGKSLEEVKAAADAVIEASASMGVSFSVVRRLKPESIKLDKMEVGLGIHGEPGARVEDMASADRVVEIIMEGIMAGKRMKAAAPNGYACLINSLGNVPLQELCILTGSLMKSRWGPSIKMLVGPALLCTSIDMNGVSFSLLRLTPEFSGCLSADTSCVAWPRAVEPSFPEPVKGIAVPDVMDGSTPSSDEDVMAVIQKVCKALCDAKGLLDELDGKVGDADCGSTMALAAESVLREKEKLPMADPVALCSCLSSILGRSMGGSSGVLLSIMFMGMSSSLEKSEKKTWSEGGAQALMDGLKAMMDAGGAEAGSRTMLDALLPAAESLLAGGGFAGARDAAVAGAEATKGMTPKAGRSENVSKASWDGIPDPGAKAAAVVFAALA